MRLPLCAAFVLLNAGALTPAFAAGRSCPVPRERDDAKTLVVAPGSHYAASGLHQLLFGRDYRALWATPVRVPVLDLRRYDGGLVPKKEGGGMQTLSLQLVSPTEQEYRFRSVDKEPTKLLPRALRATVAGSALQDQTASSLPAASLVVGPLLDRVGILNAPTRLVVMADDEALGEFRKQFAGMLGTVEAVPRAGTTPTRGFEGVSDVKSSEQLFKLMAKRPDERVDAREFLKARLVDLVIGDWDRHEGQWRWGRSRESGLWRPIPRDRDQAFSRFEGVVLSAVRVWAPRLVVFSSRYPRIEGLVWNSREIDRRLLSPLSWSDWQAAIAAVQAALDEETIKDAVCHLPPEHQALVGALLESALRARTRALPRAAAAFYRILSDQVDVQATEGDDVAKVDRRPDGAIRVRLTLAGETEPWFDRTFVPDETREVRLYLGGGNDQVTTSGRFRERIKLRAVGGKGQDALDDSQGGGTRFYDTDADTRIVDGPHTRFDREPWDPPNADAEDPPRDWGHSLQPTPWFAYYTDVGALAGVGLHSTTYGFRDYPYAHRHTLRFGYATRAGAWRAEYVGDFRRRARLEPRSEIVAVASGFEVLRFYGFGNERPAPGPDERYLVNQQQYLLSPSLVLPVPSGTFSFGPLVRYSSTQLEPGQLVASLKPYGTGGFGQAGLRTGLRFDLRDRPDAARKGLLFTSGATFYPALWTVQKAFGNTQASLATYVPLPRDASIAVRLAGQKNWGRYPFHEAAFIGSWDTVRGLPQSRYAGDAALFANTELRVPLTGVDAFFQGRLGVFALADFGRVYFEGEPSRRWHRGVGGGAWVSFEKGTRVINAALASSEGHLGFYLHGGMVF